MFFVRRIKKNFVKEQEMEVKKENSRFKLAKLSFSLLSRKGNSELPRGFRGANVTPC